MRQPARAGTRTLVTKTPRRTAGAAAAVLLSLLAACSGPAGGAAQAGGTSAPGTTATPRGGVARAGTPGTPGQADGLRTAPPGSLGLSGTALARIAAEARAANSNCLLVMRYGTIAGEWYFHGTGRDTTQNVFSVTKSVTSVLVGIAQDEGDLRIGDSAARWIPQWRGTPAAAVTVRDLLSNDSGRYWSLVSDYVQLIGATDRTAFAVSLRQAHRPGTVWAYNNAAVQTLQRVLRNATGQDVAAFAERRLFRPAGMDQTFMTRDGAGNPQTFEGVQSDCRDMARFGQLMLDDGRVRSKRIVSASWVRQSTGKSSTKLNAAYGYLWWLNRRGVLAGPLKPVTLQRADDPATPRSRLVPGAPGELYWAIGLGNQIVQVDPATRTVVVRLGSAQARPAPPVFGPAQASQVVTRAITGR